MINYEKRKKLTRAFKRGTAIFCPHCKEVDIVYSFNWSITQCPNCKIWIAKTEFLVANDFSEFAKSLRKRIPIDITPELIERILERTPKTSIIDQTVRSIKDTPDYILFLNFQNIIDFLENRKLAENEIFDCAWLNMIQQYYEQAESNDIGELRKQKLLRIKNAENQDERNNH